MRNRPLDRVYRIHKRFTLIPRGSGEFFFPTHAKFSARVFKAPSIGARLVAHSNQSMKTKLRAVNLSKRDKGTGGKLVNFTQFGDSMTCKVFTVTIALSKVDVNILPLFFARRLSQIVNPTVV